MSVGLVRLVEHEGRKLHVQVEDLGPREPVYDVRVYEDGAVLFHKKVPHAEAPGTETPEQRKDRLKHAAEKIFVTLAESIKRGKLPPNGG